MHRPIVYLLLLILVSGVVPAAELEDVLMPLLEGEFALQRGDAEQGAAAYLRAANESTDPVVARRAVQAALATGNAELAQRGLRRWAELSDDPDELMAARLRLALLKDDAKAAHPPLNALLQQDNGWRQATAALMTSPHPALSTRLLDELLEADRLPATLEVWLAFGAVALRLEDRDLYSRLAAAVEKRFPKEPRALAWRAEEAINRNELKTARRVLDAALALPNLAPDERLTIAAQLNALGDPAGAAEALEKAGDGDRVLGARAAYLSRAGSRAGLEALYLDAVAKTPEQEAPSARLMLLGQLAEMLEQPEAALRWYGQIAGGLQREQAQLRIAVLLDDTGAPDKARELLREIQVSDTEWGDIVRDAYLLESELARRHGDPAAELGALNRGLGIFEDDTALRYARALAYERGDQLEEAIADLRQLVEQEPDDADFLNALGYTLVDRTDALEEGLALIEQAIALKPGSPAILDSLGWALHRLGRDAEALPHLKRAFETLREAEIGAHLAVVLASLGELDEARSVLRLAQEIEPENRAVRHAIERLATRAGAP